jgi:RNA polymerase sigma factor (sigma-70 family)
MRLSGVDLMSSGSSSARTTGTRWPSGAAPPGRRLRDGGLTTTDPRVADTAEAAADFQRVRSRLFGIAYQVVGGVADAEDVVQDVWIRWQGADRARVNDRVAFLVTVTTRIALNAATSARARREVSVGASVPERGLAHADPAVRAELSEAAELAVHFLIERLSPVERAVYVLREAFDYPFRDIAEVLGTSDANARQLAHRARKHLTERCSHPVDPAERDGFLGAFLDAAGAGNMARLIHVLTDAIVRPGTDGRTDTAVRR